MTFASIPNGSPVFLDANVLVYIDVRKVRDRQCRRAARAPRIRIAGQWIRLGPSGACGSSGPSAASLPTGW
jgi:hypothetical protein